ncbi:MAG: DNA polymerase III subunit delta [Candidatus Rokubacteria bacterium]|nr:DNA polymerase III subunit delta [Candidatus Rokubacteria bacterium]
MEVPALFRDLGAGRIPRLLLVHGPDPLLVDEVIDRLTEAVCPDPASVAWNREVLYADSATPEAVVTAGLALPLFGERRLVLVRGLVPVTARSIDRLRSAIEEARAQPGGWPGEETTVALVAPGADRKSPVLRLVSEAAQVEVRPPTGRAVVGWLRARARAAGLDLGPQAADALITLVGEELSRLAGELEKAAVFADADGRVTEEVVAALVGESRVRQYWELSQALEEGEGAKALRVLDQLLVAGDEPTALLGQIVGYLRDVWRVKAALGERKDARQVAKLLPRNRPPFAVERLMARAAAMRAGDLEAAMRRCFDVERRLKSSGGDPRTLLTTLVADVARA